MNIFNSPRLKERREGFERLNDLLKNKAKCLIVHYSCESFVTSHGRTPRVTSICVRSFATGQTTSFSIHLQAQFDRKDFNNLTDDEYDDIELNMLNSFSEFLNKHSQFKWIHWNMRDSNYGFIAINNRIQILRGAEFEISDDLKYDLPRILGLIYTHDYEKDRPKGKLLNLAERNQISIMNALTGAEEADAFDRKEYLKLHISTLRKVDIIDTVLNKVERDDLKVNASKKHIYGLTFPGIIALIKETPWLSLITLLLGYLIGTALEPIIQRIFRTN
jgi:hypothetical protein